jgi:hypothetical protein
LQQKHRALRRTPPDQLAAFALAVLHIDIATRVFQAAISKCAVYEHTIVEDQVLVFEDFAFVSVHGRLHPACSRSAPSLGADASNCFNVEEES